jgi:hypothetical protein
MGVQPLVMYMYTCTCNSVGPDTKQQHWDKLYHLPSHPWTPEQGNGRNQVPVGHCTGKSVVPKAASGKTRNSQCQGIGTRSLFLGARQNTAPWQNNGTYTSQHNNRVTTSCPWYTLRTQHEGTGNDNRFLTALQTWTYCHTHTYILGTCTHEQMCKQLPSVHTHVHIHMHTYVDVRT